jgi:hypothetical protein
MTNLKINNTQYDLPESFSEITLEDYCNYFNGLSENPDNSVKKAIDNEISILAKMMGTKKEAIYDLPVGIAGKLHESIRFIYDDSEFRKKIKNEIIIDGEKYFIPNVNDMSLRQWIDCDMTAKGEESPERFIELLACLLVDKKYGRYEGENKSLLKKLKTIPASEALPLLYFFLFKGQNLKKITQKFLQAEQEVNRFADNINNLSKTLTGSTLRRQ